MSSATTKRLGAAIVLVLAPALHVAIPGSSWIRTSAAVAAGLMMIFFSRERIHDERVQDLKFKALNGAFSVSFTLTLIVNWFLNRDFDARRDFDGATGVLRSISAFDLIVLTMVVALGAVPLLALPGRGPVIARWRESQRVSRHRLRVRRAACAAASSGGAALVFAVAADREVRMVRQLRQHLGRMARVRPRHLAATYFFAKLRPLRRRLRRQPQLHRLQARRQGREPHVVIVALRELALRHAARRPAHRADARALARRSRAAQADDANAHESLQRGREQLDARGDHVSQSLRTGTAKRSSPKLMVALPS